MKIFAVAVCASALALAPSPAVAQFTAAVVPPNAMLIDSAAPAAVTVANGALAEPGAASHVDSSLGALDSAFGRDTRRSVTATGAGASASTPAATAVESSDSDPDAALTFRDGAAAPDTSTAVPAIALLGAGTLLLGVALFRR